MLIGLTGMSGAGKSTVAALFEKRGFRVIDCDALVHSLYEDWRYAALIKEKVPAKRKRFFSPAPPDKEIFSVVMDTFQISRSKLLRDRTDFQLFPIIARDIILKEKL